LLAACAHKQPLVVPTTPPSERNENPGLEPLPASDHKPSKALRDCISPEDCFNAALEVEAEGDRANASATLRRRS